LKIVIVIVRKHHISQTAQEITFISICKVGFRVRSNMMNLMSDYYR